MAKKTKTTKTKTVEEAVAPVAIEETKEQMPSSNPTVNEVTDKLEDAATAVIEKAKDDKHPWYTKVGLYIAATILGGLAFLFANFGDTILVIIEKWLNGLAQ